MGRSKHKKLKSHDPFYRGPRKNVKGVNLRPEDEDDQPVPKSLVRLMKSAELLKKTDSKRKRNLVHSGGISEPLDSIKFGGTPAHSHKKKATPLSAKDESTPGQEGREKSEDGAMFKRRKGEGLKSYLERIDVEANARIMEAHRKNRKLSERRKKYLEERRKKVLARKKGLTAEEEQIVEFSDLKDEVKFGEVVSAPPQLQAKPRGSEAKSMRSKTLLLHQKVPPSSQEPPSKTRHKAPVVGLKRKQDLEIERERAISVYRQKKKARINIDRTTSSNSNTL